MKTKTILITSVLTLALASPAHAQLNLRNIFKPQPQTQQEQVDKDATDLPGVEVQGEQQPKVDQGRAVQSGVQGCGVGALVGGLLGVDPNVACAVGGLAGYGLSYRKQLRAARQVETAARAAGMTATVETEQVVDEKGKTQEALKALVIEYDPADMVALDAKTQSTLDKLAGLAKAAKNQLTLRFEGANPACSIPLQELGKRGALVNHIVDNQCDKGGKHQIVVSPIPDVR